MSEQHDAKVGDLFRPIDNLDLSVRAVISKSSRPCLVEDGVTYYAYECRNVDTDVAEVWALRKDEWTKLVEFEVPTPPFSVSGHSINNPDFLKDVDTDASPMIDLEVVSTHAGSALDSLFEETGDLEEVEALTKKKIEAYDVIISNKTSIRQHLETIEMHKINAERKLLQKMGIESNPEGFSAEQLELRLEGDEVVLVIDLSDSWAETATEILNEHQETLADLGIDRIEVIQPADHGNVHTGGVSWTQTTAHEFLQSRMKK
jgi:hypothetical protein